MPRIVRRRRPAVRRPKRMMRRKGVGRARVKRTSDYAKCVEIQETQLVAVNDQTGEAFGGIITFALADFQRPQEIAHAYKYYRASKCEVTWIPYYNIAQTGGGNATRMPQLYYGIDRVSNRFIAPTESECLERGMTPRLFTRKCKLSFKPNLLQELALETNQPSEGGGTGIGVDTAGFLNQTALFDKWLPTQQSYGYSDALPGQVGQVLAPNGVNPYAVRYHGAIFCPSIEGLTTATPVGDIQVKITWEFKGPRALKTQPPLPEPNTYANTSSQGSSHAVPNTQPTTYP